MIAETGTVGMESRDMKSYQRRFVVLARLQYSVRGLQERIAFIYFR